MTVITHKGTKKTLLAAFSVLLVTGQAALAAYVPFPVAPSSYTADVVVESNAIPVLRVVTTASVDNGTNNTANTWYEVGYNTNTVGVGTGLPAAGTTFTAISNANYTFRMAPSYAAPNALLINATRVTNGTFTFTTPAAYQRLSFLASGGNGGDLIGVIVRHQDGSSESNSISSPDWFSAAIPELAIAAGGRVSSTVDFGFSNVGPDANGNLFPRLFYRDVVLTNTTSPVTSADLYYISGPANANNAIFAVSGATTVGGLINPITVTGYTYDFVVEATAPRRGRVTAADGVTFATSQSMDNELNTGNSWYQKGYNVNNFRGSPAPKPTDDLTGTGLPAPGTTVTNAAGDAYILPPTYIGNNVVYLGPTNGNATITFTTPAAYSALSLLASAGNGPVRPLVILHHLNGAVQTNSVSIRDWFNNTEFVVGTGGRVTVNTAQLDVPNNTNMFPRLFSNPFTVAETVSPITSIDLVYTNTGGRTAIFAVSGTSGSIAPFFTTQPASQTVNAGVTVSLVGAADSNIPITYQWQRGTNGVFVNLVNGGNISGATTTNLVISSAGDTDDADYRVIASNAAGTVNSGTAVVTIISALQDVTQPTDSIVAYQPSGGSSPGAEGVANAINNNTTKYLNFGNAVTPVSVPLGFIVTPGLGRTIVSGIRFYAANDAAERDPANSILEGSNDGGGTWSLISSNAITIPDTRNAAGLALDPLTQSIRQVRFVNTNGFTAYRWFLTRVKGNASLMQIGEVELLGIQDLSGVPNFITPPASKSAYVNGSVTFDVTVGGNPTPGVRWLRGTNGVYTFLTDGGRISGANSTSLTINSLSFTDAVDYAAVATNSSGSVTSAPAHLTVLSTLLDVTTPGDPITGFGDLSGIYGGVATVVANAIDNDPTVKYQNGGSGFNSSASFPPFVGPVGLVVTPSVGPTTVSGLRIYSADGNTERDPADYRLEGSNNGGTNFTVISSGALNLPLARSSNLNPFDPLIGPLQEVLFSNNVGYGTYRLTFTNSRDNNSANSLQIGELELLGVTSQASPTLSVTRNGNGTITIGVSGGGSGTLQTTTNLVNGGTIWQTVGPISGSTTITPLANEPIRFYRVTVP